jgi:type I restriction enzyme S subunit
MIAIQGWETKRFDEFGTIFSGSTPSTAIRSFWDGEIVWVTPYDLSRINTPYLNDSAKRITEKGLQGCSATLLPPKSLVMSSRAPIGYVALPTVSFCTNQGCKTMKLKSEINPEFAYYNVLFNIDKVKNLGEGTTFAEISKTALSTVAIPFPKSKPEQTKIAEILSTVDRAIEQTEALIAKQQRLKTGLMQDLLTRGIDEHGNLRSEQTHPFKDSPLGRIPVEWEVKQIKDLGLVVTGNTPSEFAFADDHQSAPFITPADVGVTSAIQKTTRSFGKTSATSVRMIPAGSICVVCIGSTIGKIGVTVGEAATNQQINTVIPHESKTSEFLLHSMLLYLPSQLRKEAGLQAVPIVNKSTFERLLIAIPRDSKEAIEIQRQISSPAAIAESGTRNLVKLRSLKTALMQDLLTGRKRVTALLDGKEASA